MKIKKLTAAILSAATMLSMAQMPLTANPFAQFESSTTLTAEAADSIIAYVTVNSAMYALYSNRDAVLLAAYDSVSTLTVPEYITYNNDRYLVRKVSSCACQNKSSLTKVDMSAATYLQEIGNNAFSGNNKLTEVKLPNSVTKIGASAFKEDSQLKTCNMPSRLVTIGGYAFCGTSISGTVTFGASLRDIDSSAFLGSNSIASYSVPTSNINVKSVSGVLYNRTGDTLILYPPKKSSTSYKVTSKYIEQFAFNKTPALQSLDISLAVFCNYYRNSSTWEFPALNTLKIPASDYSKYCKNGDLDTLAYKYARFFIGTKLLTVNGKKIVCLKSDGEPYFNAEYEQFIYDHFDELSVNPYFMDYYRTTMLDYVVNSVTTASMTDMQKAVRLHEWICRRVEYDPTEKKYWDYKAQDKTPDPSWLTYKNHDPLSVFLHKVGSKYYTVCQGYALCYKMLLEKAGIEAYYVNGQNKAKESGGSHAWNLVKLNNRYYHIDVCWDDLNFDKYIAGDVAYKDYYKYFMKTDTDFTKDDHGKYNWQINSPYSANHSIMNSLGDVNLDLHLSSTDRTKLQNYLSNETQFFSNSADNNKAKINADANLDGRIDQMDLNVVYSALNSKYYTVFDYLTHTYEKYPTNA